MDKMKQEQFWLDTGKNPYLHAESPASEQVAHSACVVSVLGGFQDLPG